MTRSACLLSALLILSGASASAVLADELYLTTSSEIYRPGDTINANALVANARDEPATL